MLLSTVKLALLAHSILVTDTSIFIKGTFEANSRAYQSAIRNLASLAASETVTLKHLKAKAEGMGYFNFRNNRDLFTNAVWKARERLINGSKEQEKTVEKDAGETVDVTSDSSTSSDVVKKEVKKTSKKTTAKSKKAE